MLTLDDIANFVALAYIDLIYDMSPSDSHYVQMKELLTHKLSNIWDGNQETNPFQFLMSPQNKCNLLHNLPRMQILLNHAIERSTYTPRDLMRVIQQIEYVK